MYTPEEVRPKEALRFEHVFEQGFDSSCGYSAAASLLALYWDKRVDEAALIERFASEALAEGRFLANMEGLSRIFSDYGLSVKGVMMSWEQLAIALNGFAPILVHYDRPDRHFALALRARYGWIITLDPAMGCELQSRDQFMERWSGAALVVASSVERRNEARIAEAIRVESDRQYLLDRLGL
jgi:predicted double-glycine peptidase